MKKYIIIGIAFLILISIIGIMGKIISNKNNEYKRITNNNKALCLELKNNNDKVIMYEYTIDQLSYYNDSILSNLDSIRQELKIKDKQLKQMSYQKSIITKTDTLILKDSIKINIDTITGDKWYQLYLKTIEPDTLIVMPKFISEQSTIISSKKETINKPKKFFLFRWFQKKHEIITVDVIEQNPYITNEKTRYIEIIK